MSDCQFCSEFNGKPPADLIEAGMPYPRLVAENDDFALVPTVGCITPGYLVLCPKDHFYSFAQLDPELQEQIPAITKQIRAINRHLYDCETLIAEHGSTFCETGAACCDHAHLHFIPIMRPLFFRAWDLYCKHGYLDRMSVVHLKQLHNFSDRSYVLYSEDGEKYAVWDEPDEDRGFGSQFCRRIAAKLWNNEQEWNWRTHPNYPNLERTLQQWKGALDRLQSMDRLIRAR